MRIMQHLDLTLVELTQPTISPVDEPPTDAAPGTLIFDPAKQRLRLRVEGGWVTLNASGFTPDA